MLGDIAVEGGVMLMALTETHLNTDILDAEVKINHYQLFRSDRLQGTRKGGVAMYVADTWADGVMLLASGSTGVVEHLLIHFVLLQMVVAVVYRPPSSPVQHFTDTLDILRAEIDKLGTPMPTVVITGDFNLPIICWDDWRVCAGTEADRKQADALKNFAAYYVLDQLVDTPTRVNNILDLFFTNNPELVSRIEVCDTVMSDHRQMNISTTISPEINRSVEVDQRGDLFALNFNSDRVDWEGLCESFSVVDWELLIGDLEPNETLAVMMDKIASLCKPHVPLRIARSGAGRIPRDRRILMRKRTKLRRMAERESVRGRRLKIATEIEVVESKLIDSHRRENDEVERRAVRRIKENPKCFYKYARSKSVIKSRIGPLVVDGRLLTDSTQKSAALLRQFSSVYSEPMYTEAENSLEIMETEGENPEGIVDVDFGPVQIKQSISELSPWSAAGPDGIPAILLRKCADELSIPLAIFWRKTMNCGSIPDALKRALITPIHKGGPRDDPKNYRPIALTSHLIKVFEKVIVKQLVAYLEENDLFNRHQHGFRSGRSCLSQLLEHYQRVLQALGDGSWADVIHLDFAKAFDKVDHGILLRKLRRLGVGGPLLRWIRCFLLNREQNVVVEGELSHTFGVASGVPQGSVLGPLLFLVHISDVDVGLVRSTASSFADDTRLLMEVREYGDCLALQEDLEAIFQWARSNNMQFNGAKFELLRFGVNSPSYQYVTEDGGVIERKSCLRDLGVMISDTACFADQVQAAVNCGQKRIGWILRVFRTRERELMLALYKTMVLPLMEYCCQLWNPQSLGLIRKMEAVQRTFTFKIDGIHGDYWERLKNLKMYSLQRRRERYIVMYVWKIIQGMVPNIGIHPVMTVRHIRRGRLCVVPQVNRGLSAAVRVATESSFAFFGPRLFNCLTSELREFDGSLDTFKKRLDVFLQSVPDRPPLQHYHQSAAGNSLIQQLAQMRAEMI